MTAGHLVTNGNLSLLCNINTYKLIYAWADIVAVFSCVNLNVNNYACCAVRNTKRCISNFSCFFTENSTKKSFFCCKLCFTLWCNLAYKYIVRSNFRTDTDNSSFVKVTKCIVAYVRNISCNFFRSEFCISCLCFIFINMNRCVNIFLNKFFTKKNGIFVVVTFPSHETDKRVFTKGKFTV